MSNHFRILFNIKESKDPYTGVKKTRDWTLK